jgi:hypothetical protein
MQRLRIVLPDDASFAVDALKNHFSAMFEQIFRWGGSGRWATPRMRRMISRQRV